MAYRTRSGRLCKEAKKGCTDESLDKAKTLTFPSNLQTTSKGSLLALFLACCFGGNGCDEKVRILLDDYFP